MERAVVLRRFAGLAEFYGTGRKLTATGNPTLADGRLLVGLLDLDDELDPSFGSRTSVTRSAGELHDLTFTIRWALRAGAVRKVHGRLAATATWSKAGTTEHFRRAAEALVSAGPLVLRHGIEHGYQALYELVDSAVPALLDRLGDGPLELTDATEELCTYLEARYEFRGWLSDAGQRRRSFGRDLEWIARMFDLAGIASFDGPVPADPFDIYRPLTGTIELSEAGRWWLAQASQAAASAPASASLPGFKYRPRPQRSTTLHELTVTLDNVVPPVWRDFVVPSRLSLGELHTVLQIVMGWEDYHLHQFEIGGARYAIPDDEDPDWGLPTRDEDLTRLGDVAPAHATFSYEYDFGDSWDHTIDVRSISRIAGDDANPEIPRCTAGARACPPEDAGGTWGYKELLEAARDPSHEEHESSLTWMGAGFDPERFDLDAVNVALELAFQERARAVGRDTGG